MIVLEPGEDRRQAEPVERDPDELRGSAGGSSDGRSRCRVRLRCRVCDHRPVLRRDGFDDMNARVVVPLRPRSRDTARRSYATVRGVPSGPSATRRSERHEPPVGGTRGDEAEQRSIERVDAGRDEADPAEPEREDRVLAIARVVMRRAVGREDGEVGLAPEPVVQGGQQMGGRLIGPPGVLQPAGADLGIGSPVDPALGAVRGAQAIGSRAGRRCG